MLSWKLRYSNTLINTNILKYALIFVTGGKLMIFYILQNDLIHLNNMTQTIFHGSLQQSY